MRMRACGFRVERPVTAPEPQEKHSGLVSASVCRVLGRCARIAARSICATFLASESTLPRVITTRVRLHRCLPPPSHARPLGNSERCDSVEAEPWTEEFVIPGRACDACKGRLLAYSLDFGQAPPTEPWSKGLFGSALPIRHCPLGTRAAPLCRVCLRATSGLHSCHTVFQCMMRVALPQSARSQALPRC